MKIVIPIVISCLIGSVVVAQQSSVSLEPVNVKLTDSIACTSVKDQGQSGTCWAFGSNSLFESDLQKKFGVAFDLSEMYFARYAYLDKAARFLETNGKTYYEGGGQFHDVIRVIEKYGIVPENVYTGRLNEEMSHDHSKLDTSMKRLVHQWLDNGKRRLEAADRRQLEDTLDKYLGKVPVTFMYKQKMYTPISFAKELLQFKNDYVELVSFSDHPLYKRFILEDKYNWASDSFYNVSLDDLHMILDTALHKGFTIGWEGDVTEKEFHYFGGYAAFPDAKHRYDEERLDNYKIETTERDHMLHITGVGKDEHNKKWYYLKNSWGNFSALHGYIYMEENYFRLKTVILFVNKAGLPTALKQKLGIK